MISKLYQEKKSIILIIGVIFFLIILFIFNLFSEEKEVEIPLLEEKEEIVEIASTIRIDIKGAVNNPGVYE